MAYDKESIERTIVSTVVMLCKNSMAYTTELRIQGLLGITVDDDVLLVQINERFDGGTDHEVNAEPHPEQAVFQSQPPKRMHSIVTSGPRRGVVPTYVRRAAVPRARQQLAFPGPKKEVPRKMQMSVKRSSSNPLQNRNMPAGKVKKETFSHQPSSDVICVESDEETAEQMYWPRSTGTPVKPKIECHISGLVENALNKAKVIQQQQSMSFEAVEFSSYTNDVKPIVSPSMHSQSSVQSLVPWTPTKPRTQHPMPIDRGTSSLPLKSEFTASLTPTGKAMHSPMRSPAQFQGQSPWKAPARSPSVGRAAIASEDSPSETSTWTSVTQTTFVCTTGGCEKHFTTKRALVHHQKNKHLLNDGDTSSS